MPVHTLNEHEPVDEQLRAIESSNQEIVQVMQAGGRWLVVTKRKAGRPPKETR